MFVGKGWSLNYMGNYWMQNTPHYALTTLGVQKDMSIGDRFDLSLAYNRWLLHDDVRKNVKQFTQNIEADEGYELGNFTAGFYSMFLFGKSFSNFSSPSLSFNKSTWWGSNKNIRYAVTATTLANIGNYDASFVPFQRTAKILHNKKKGVTVQATPAAQTVSSKNFGLLNYEAQLEQEICAGNSSFKFILTHSIPSALLKNNQVTKLTYFTLEYQYNLFVKKHRHFN